MELCKRLSALEGKYSQFATHVLKLLKRRDIGKVRARDCQLAAPTHTRERTRQLIQRLNRISPIRGTLDTAKLLNLNGSLRDRCRALEGQLHGLHRQRNEQNSCAFVDNGPGTGNKDHTASFTLKQELNMKTAELAESAKRLSRMRGKCSGGTGRLELRSEKFLNTLKELNDFKLLTEHLTTENNKTATLNRALEEQNNRELAAWTGKHSEVLEQCAILQKKYEQLSTQCTEAAELHQQQLNHYCSAVEKLKSVVGDNIQLYQGSGPITHSEKPDPDSSSLFLSSDLSADKSALGTQPPALSQHFTQLALKFFSLLPPLTEEAEHLKRIMSTMLSTQTS